MPPLSDRVGDLAIVLHSHMPYVEGFGTYPFGEEWLFDAVLRSYLPVTEVADRVTMTVTPVLADQLEAPGVAERLGEFGRSFRLEACEAEAREVETPYADACLAEAGRYRRAIARLDELGDDLLGIFRRPFQEGRVELVASAATHAVLPLVATVPGRRLQLDAGLRSHARRFGRTAGLWLPECAYEPGLESLLGERDLGFFCVDQSAHEEPLAALAPVAERLQALGRCGDERRAPAACRGLCRRRVIGVAADRPRARTAHRLAVKVGVDGVRRVAVQRPEP